MSKECKGKYHGDGIKIIDDDEEYCLICQQEIDCKKKANTEKAVKIAKTVGSLAVSVIGSAVLKILVGGKSGGNNRA